jgi:hypothetical protein
VTSISARGDVVKMEMLGRLLEKWELEKLNEYYEVIKPYMTAEGINEINKQGKYLYDTGILDG